MYLFDPNNDADIERLKEMPEINADIENFDNILRYLIYMYDIESPYRKLYPHYPQRKKECALKANFKINKKTNLFSPEDEEILLGGNDIVNCVTINYLKLFNNPDYIQYVSFWHMYEKTAERSLKEVDDKIIKIIKDNMNAFSSSISKLEESIFGGKEVLSMRNALYASMVNERLLRPEEIAKQIAEKNLNLKTDPYYS